MQYAYHYTETSSGVSGILYDYTVVKLKYDRVYTLLYLYGRWFKTWKGLIKLYTVKTQSRKDKQWRVKRIPIKNSIVLFLVVLDDVIDEEQKDENIISRIVENGTKSAN